MQPCGTRRCLCLPPPMYSCLTACEDPCFRNKESDHHLFRIYRYLGLRICEDCSINWVARTMSKAESQWVMAVVERFIRRLQETWVPLLFVGPRKSSPLEPRNATAGTSLLLNHLPPGTCDRRVTSTRSFEYQHVHLSTLPTQQRQPQHYRPLSIMFESESDTPSSVESESTSLYEELTSASRPNKRRCGDTRQELSAAGLNSAIEEACSSRPTAELALLHLIERYKFDLTDIMNKLQGSFPIPPLLWFADDPARTFVSARLPSSRLRRLSVSTLMAFFAMRLHSRSSEPGYQDRCL